MGATGRVVYAAVGGQAGDRGYISIYQTGPEPLVSIDYNLDLEEIYFGYG